MAKLVSFFSPARKRDRSSSNESNEITPAGKRSTFNQLETTDELDKSIFENTKEENIEDMDTNNKRDCLEMDTNLRDLHPDWATDLLLKVSEIQKKQEENTLTLHSINICTEFLESKVDTALLDLAAAKSDIKTLTKKFDTLSLENNMLKKKPD